MATTTRTTLQANLATVLGFYYSGTNTGTGTATVVDTEIQRWNTGRLTNRWVLMTSGTNSGNARQISSVSSSTATVAPAWAAANANGNTFRILPYDPTIMNNAIQQACRTAWPKRVGRGAAMGLYVRTTDETLIADNLLLNPSFELGTFTSWTNIGTPTNTANATRRVHGSQSAQIAASGATEGIEQDVLALLDMDRIVGKTFRFQGWVWASVASAVRLRVTFDGTTFTNGPWHVGDDEWEGPSIHTISVSIPAGATEAMVSCEVTDGNTGYFDLVSAWVDPIWEYTMPTAFYPNGPSRMLYQVNSDQPEGLYLPVNGYRAPAGAVLRLEGQARLSVPTTDAGTTEVDEIEGEFLIAEAASIMFGVLKNTERELRAEYEEEQRTWVARSDVLRASVGHGFMSANERNGWGISPENSRMLYLLR